MKLFKVGSRVHEFTVDLMKLSLQANIYKKKIQSKFQYVRVVFIETIKKI